MRRFNLMKPANAGEADDQAPPEPTAPHPSRRRIFLLSLLLVAVVALAAKNFIGTYFAGELGTPLPAPERVVAPPTGQSPQPSPAPSIPAAVVIPERPAKASDSDGAPQSNRTVASPPEKSAQPEPPQARAVQVQEQEPVNPSAPKAALKGRFSVQVGAMAHEVKARALRQRLEKLGYPVTIQTAQTPSTQHLVLVTAPDDRSEAGAVVGKLKAGGIPATVSESDGRYRVEAGRSVVLDQAIDLAHELQKKGFTPKIVSETASSTLYLVRVGQFTSRAEARNKAKALREKGFPTLIIKK